MGVNRFASLLVERIEFVSGINSKAVVWKPTDAPRPDPILATAAEEAVNLRSEIGFRSRSKFFSPDLVHKTEVGRADFERNEEGGVS